MGAESVTRTQRIAGVALGACLSLLAAVLMGTAYTMLTWVAWLVMLHEPSPSLWSLWRSSMVAAIAIATPGTIYSLAGSRHRTVTAKPLKPARWKL